MHMHIHTKITHTHQRERGWGKLRLDGMFPVSTVTSGCSENPVPPWKYPQEDLCTFLVFPMGSGYKEALSPRKVSCASILGLTPNLIMSPHLVPES